MTEPIPTDQGAQGELYGVTSKAILDVALGFAHGVESKFSKSDCGRMYLAAAVMLLAADFERAGAIAMLRQLADTLELETPTRN